MSGATFTNSFPVIGQVLINGDSVDDDRGVSSDDSDDSAPSSGVRLIAAPPSRPKTRGECVNGVRPCPWAGCRHHLLLDVKAKGRLEMYADEPDQLAETCSLDVADRGGESNRDVAALIGGVTTRQAVQETIAEAGRKLDSLEVRDLLGFVHPPYGIDLSDMDSDIAGSAPSSFVRLNANCLPPLSASNGRVDPEVTG